MTTLTRSSMQKPIMSKAARTKAPPGPLTSHQSKHPKHTENQILSGVGGLLMSISGSIAIMRMIIMITTAVCSLPPWSLRAAGANVSSSHQTTVVANIVLHPHRMT